MAKKFKLSEKDDCDLCSINDYAQTIDSTPAAVRKGLQRGIGPDTVRLGHCIKFRVADVKAFLSSLERVPVARVTIPAAENAARTTPAVGRPRLSTENHNHK